MKSTRIPFLLLFLTAAATVVWPAKYKVKELPSRAADEYDAHQDFQNLVIGAAPCETAEKAKELFDTDKLHERGILPVLVVLQNNNDFPVYVDGSRIFLVDPEGTQWPPLSFVDVLLEITLNRPLSSYSTKKDLLVRQTVRKEMYLDFEQKAFGERIIPPYGSDRGVVFFQHPGGETLQGFRLYFPEVINFKEKEPLMFFEFDLQP